MNKIPANYRQLKPTETLRKGDLYHQKSGNQSIDIMPADSDRSAGSWTDYVFFRRRHTAVKPVAKPVAKTLTQPVKVATKGDKKLVVTFIYPSRKTGKDIERTVQVISLTREYLTGLEITNVWSDENLDYLPRYQFKKFTRGAIRYSGDIQVVSYE
jgi:hypothetical protein